MEFGELKNKLYNRSFSIRALEGEVTTLEDTCLYMIEPLIEDLGYDLSILKKVFKKRCRQS